MSERKIVQTAVVPAGQELNFGNGVAVVNGTQDHMKARWQIRSNVLKKKSKTFLQKRGVSHENSR